ncbi:MAG: RNA polymerase sigma factor [Bacillota bacterium]|nr:RNA polymerase sigma factor [Bacillota bacterium]
MMMVQGQSPVMKELHVDDELILRIGRDDPEAFHTFYEQTEKALYAYILSLVRHHHDAEDVMHDTYMKVRSAAHLYQPQGKPMAWVFTIARNYAMMQLRSRSKDADLPPEEMLSETLFTEAAAPEDRMALQALLEELEETERSIILLHAVSGFRHREIAQDLGLPLSTVLSKYNRGLKKLRRRLEEEGGRR